MIILLCFLFRASRIIALSQRIMELSAGNGIVGVRLSEFVMTRFASKASTSGRGLLTFIQSFELSFSVRALLRLSPQPWTVEELEACFVVTDNAVQKLAYVYFEDESGDARRPSSSAKMRREGLQRISPSCRSYCERLDAGAISMPSRLPPIRATGVRLAKSDQIHRRGSSTSHRVELLPSGFYP